MRRPTLARPAVVHSACVSAQEVERAFLAPLSVLLDPSHKSWMKGQSGVRLPVYGGAEEKIWGLCGALLRPLPLLAFAPLLTWRWRSRTAYALHQLFHELGGASLME